MLNEERGETGDHFEYNIAEGPPVDCEANVEALLEYLRGQIFRGSRNGIGCFEVVGSAAKSKID
jgi:hypothetical protein